MKRSSKYLALLSTAALAIAPVFAQEEGESAEEADERTLQTVVVRGAFIPEPQRETSQVASFLSEEDLIRQGDANAALALARVSGLSVVSDKFAFVRDLFLSYILGGAAVQ